MFKLTINTDNAAFDDGVGDEIARILEDLAARLRKYPVRLARDTIRLSGSLQDINGNNAGVWSFNDQTEQVEAGAIPFRDLACGQRFVWHGGTVKYMKVGDRAFRRVNGDFRFYINDDDLARLVEPLVSADR